MTDWPGSIICRAALATAYLSATFCRARYSVLASDRVLGIAVATPRVLRIRPWVARVSRSRCTVIRLTPKASGRSSIFTEPAAITISRIAARRSFRPRGRLGLSVPAQPTDAR